MQILPANLAIANQRAHLEPIFVLEIMWADGAHGTEGTNDIYFSSSDISNIVNFPYPNQFYPILDPASITGLSQTVDPLNGVSSIGSMSFRIVDRNNYFSDIVRAADVAGYGLRRQLCQLYRLESGMDWADRIKVRTMQVDNLDLAPAGTEYHLRTVDVQRQLKRDICNPVSTILTVPITVTGAANVTVGDTTILPLVPNHYYGTGGYIKINDEIMRYTAIAGSVLTVPATGRGLFGTVAATHTQSDPVNEIIVLRGNPVALALQLMSSTGAGTNGIWDVYPAHWGCGMDAVEDINTSEWESVGQFLTGFDTPAASDGLQFEFVIDNSIGAKSFIESEILRFIGAFGFVHGDGRYGVRAYSDLANADKNAADRTLTIDDVVKWSALKYDYTQIVNEIKLTYDKFPKYGGKYIRQAYFVDALSKTKWGSAKSLKFAVEGLVPASQYADVIYQRNHLWMSRFSRPPMRINITTLPKHFDLEIGDVIRLMLPIRDLVSGADMDRAFEVISTGITTRSGEPKLTLIAQPERVTLWQGDNVTPTIADAAYPHGTQINWDGLGGSQIVDTARALSSGDHWVNGDLTINSGQTLTVSGNTRLFVRGIFTNNGHITGRGNGAAGAAHGIWNAATLTIGDFINGVYVGMPGTPGTSGGFSGKGGNGGSRWYRRADAVYVNADPNSWQWQPTQATQASGAHEPGGSVDYNIAPSQINAQAGGVDATGAWTSVQGLPINVQGSGGGSGAYVKTQGARGGAGGNGGAGLLVMARQIYNTLGTIDLSGADAEMGLAYLWYSPYDPNVQYWLSGGGGGGGGGSCILLAERDSIGLPNMTVDTSRITVSGGLGKAGDPTRIGYNDNLAAWTGLPGSAGAIITQVIG